MRHPARVNTIPSAVQPPAVARRRRLTRRPAAGARGDADPGAGAGQAAACAPCCLCDVRCEPRPGAGLGGVRCRYMRAHTRAERIVAGSFGFGRPGPSSSLASWSRSRSSPFTRPAGPAISFWGLGSCVFHMEHIVNMDSGREPCITCSPPRSQDRKSRRLDDAPPSAAAGGLGRQADGPAFPGGPAGCRDVGTDRRDRPPFADQPRPGRQAPAAGAFPRHLVRDRRRDRPLARQDRVREGTRRAGRDAVVPCRLRPRGELQERRACVARRRWGRSVSRSCSSA